MLVNINLEWQRCFTKKRLEKPATMKRFEYLSLGKEFKLKTEISKK